jgi:hypothetical protein
MPRLGALLVCERIIIDQQNKPTLISLFQSLSALVAEGQPAPTDMIAGVAWSVFSEWFFTDEELSSPFDQVLEVLLPDGTPSPIRGRVTIKEKSKHDQGTRVYVTTFGMPMGQTGFLKVNVWLESGDKPVTEKFYYLIKAEHTTMPPESMAGQQVLALTQTQKPTTPQS